MTQAADGSSEGSSYLGLVHGRRSGDRRGLVEPTCHAQDRSPVAAQPSVRALGQAAPDLAVQPVALPAGHRDVAGERVEQPDGATRATRVRVALVFEAGMPLVGLLAG